jgi:hypothetical protein
VISFPALAFCQFEDEELLIKIANSLFPGQITGGLMRMV